jgi:uncharacterized protein (DUF849 family)
MMQRDRGADARPILLQACLNGVRRRGTHDRLPITPEECAREGAAAVAAGAGALHVHIRRDDGSESFDAVAVAATLDALRRVVAVPIGVSTGAWVMPDPGDRLAAVGRWTTLPDFASVNFHEDGASDIARALIARGIGVEAGLWNAESARSLIASGLADRCLRIMLEPIDPDLDVTFATIEETRAALRGVAPSVPRLLHGHGPTVWAVLEHAGELGYDSRIGLEDSLTLPDGSQARDNAELVCVALEILGRRHRTVAVVDDAEAEVTRGDVPPGLGPEIFRDHLQRVVGGDSGNGAEITLREQQVALADIEGVEAEADGHRSRIRLRNGLIIGGLTGAAIVAALATTRYRRRHSK